MKQEKIDLIKSKLRKGMDEFIDSISDKTIQSLFRDYSFIGGGAIASLVSGEEPNDLDLYFKTKDACYEAAMYFVGKMNLDFNCRFERIENGLRINVPHGTFKNEKVDEQKYQPLVLTGNAISFSDNVQMIIRFAGSIEEVAGNFDYLHTKGVYDYRENALIIPGDTLQAIEQKRLIYTGSAYPLASMIRSRKFIKRDWSMNAGQYLKIALELNKYDLNDPHVLKEQLIGVDSVIFISFLQALEEKNQGEIDETTLDKKFNFLFDLIDETFDKVRLEQEASPQFLDFNE